MIDDKTFLITGGTGSFGNTITNELLRNYQPKEIVIYSRDEKKQFDMRNKFDDSRLKFIIGDVREREKVFKSMSDIDFVFHAAALKQVPSCEFHPIQAVKTNIIGTENVLESAIISDVQRVVCLSTDKAVYPINSMGISKAMMEKVTIAKSRNSNSTVICIIRYGNVMASRGSVIPLFVEQIRSSNPLTITNPKMTRFMMTLPDAVNLVLYAFNNGRSGDIFIQKAPAATIETLAHALTTILEFPEYKLNIIGTRHGEKLYETLLSREEMIFAEDMGDYYRIKPDLRDLNYGKFVDQGEVEISGMVDYNSHNTTRLDLEEMKSLLMKLTYIQAAVSGNFMQQH